MEFVRDICRNTIEGMEGTMDSPDYIDVLDMPLNVASKISESAASVAEIVEDCVPDLVDLDPPITVGEVAVGAVGVLTGGLDSILSEPINPFEF